MRRFFLSLFLTLSVLTAAAQAQTEQVKPSVVPGEITSVDAANNKITLKTKDGELVVALDAKTVYRRVSPDNPTDLKSATPAALSDIGVGDNIAAVGILSADKKTITPARSVYIMTKADIAKKQQAEQQEWASGFVGRVTAVNPAGNEITVALRGSTPEKTVTIAMNDKTKFHRYAQNSVKFSDAKPSNFAEIKVGDQLRARGDKDAEGSRLTAEEVISGSFRMVAGTITAVNAAQNEVVIKEANTNKQITVTVNPDTLLRRFPPEMAQRLAIMQVMRASGQMPPGAQMGGGAGQGRPANPGGGQPGQPGQSVPQGGMGQGMGGGMARQNGDVDRMLENLPALTLAELKVGDAIAASSSTTATPDRVMAIKFVAGVEPFLNPPQIPGMGARPQTSSPSINIPGLDGIGAP